jgi:hypothetical protein
MRVVGNRKQEDIRLRLPTAAEIEANREASSRAPRVIPKGVYRYRSQDDANEAKDRWDADGLVQKALESPVSYR